MALEKLPWYCHRGLNSIRDSRKEFGGLTPDSGLSLVFSVHPPGVERSLQCAGHNPQPIVRFLQVGIWACPWCGPM